MSAATTMRASTWMHEGIVRGEQVEPILFNAEAGPMALIAFAHGQLRIASSLLSVIVRLDGDDEFAGVKCLIQPAINALELAGERLPLQAGHQGDGAGKVPMGTPRVPDSAQVTAATTRAALADAHEVLLDSCAAAGSLSAVLSALEPFKLRLEKEAALLDGRGCSSTVCMRSSTPHTKQRLPSCERMEVQHERRRCTRPRGHPRVGPRPPGQLDGQRRV